MKYWALLRTMPRRRSVSYDKKAWLRAAQMRRAEVTPMPGTRSKAWYDARLTSTGKNSGWRRAQVEVEIRRLVSQYLIGFELVEAQQPVSLVEAVLPQERRLGDGRQVGPVTAGT